MQVRKKKNHQTFNSHLQYRIETQTANIIRVDVQFEATPNMPDSVLNMTSIHVLRWRAMLALEADLQQPPRDSVALLDCVMSWRLPTPAPPIVIDGRSVSELKLETSPETSRAASGVVGVKMIITEVANCGSRGEKEILTRLEDEVINDEKWEVKIFHVWTVPTAGKVQYNMLLFQKGGIVYKSSVRCIFSKVGDNDILYLNKV